MGKRIAGDNNIPELIKVPDEVRAALSVDGPMMLPDEVSVPFGEVGVPDNSICDIVDNVSSVLGSGSEGLCKSLSSSSSSGIAAVVAGSREAVELYKLYEEKLDQTL